MSLEEAFLRDVVDHPDDDAPRLAYADWLQEQGEPVRQARGEFIAVQCAIHRDEERGHYRKGMKKRQRELLLQHRAAWLPATTVTGSQHKVEFSRGFVETVHLDGDAFPLEDYLARTRELFRLEPAIRRVSVAPAGNERNPDLIPGLLRLPEMPRLLKLGLENNRLGPDQVRALGAPSLRGLRRLVLNHNPLGDEGVAVLAGLDSLSELEALALESCRIEAGALALSRSPHLGRLLYLGLEDNELSARSLDGLAMTTGLDALKMLALSDCALNEVGVRVLTAGPLLARLPRLDLARNSLGDEGVTVLAASPHLAGVRDLNLGWNAIDDAGIAALASSPHVAGLEVLAVPCNVFGEAGSRALATSPHLGRLRALHLADHAEFSGDGSWTSAVRKIVAFVELAHLPALEDLSLNGYPHIAQVVPALLRSPLVRQLRALRMNGGGTDDVGQLLLESSAIAALEELELSLRYFGPRMWQALKERFGDRLRY